MWQREHEVETDVAAERLWAVIADVPGWPAWDAEIESTTIDGPAAAGKDFTLKPKGGPTVRLTIEEFQPPHRFVDVSHLPLAKMRTVHEFASSGAGTRIRVTIQVWGLLGFLWVRIVGKKQVAGLPAQTLKFVERARSLS